MYNSVNDINDTWVNQNEKSLQKVDALTQIHRHLGYGGFIHNFKNYVLRKDPQYLEAAHSDLSFVSNAINDLRLILLDPNDQAALGILTNTLEEYRENLIEVSKEVTSGATPAELDKIAKVNDRAALAAMQMLINDIFTESSQSQAVTSAAIERTLSVLLLGLFALPAILIASWGSVVLIRRLVATQTAFDKERRRLKLMVDNIDQGITMLDADLNHVVMNDKFNEIAGYPKDIVHVGTPMEAAVRYDAERGELGTGDVETIVRERLSQARKSEALDYTRIRSDGTVLDVRRNPIEGGGFVTTFTDVTEQVRSEEALAAAKSEAEAANAAKSQFLANMSHEIRTPMNAIIGLSHMALKGDIDSRTRDYLSKVHGAARSLLGVINDILDFSKIEAGKLTVEDVPFLLDDVLQGVTTLVADSATEKGLELVFWTEPDVPRSLVGDPLRLGQIITNLLSNAVKFTEKGEIIVRINCLSCDNDSARLSVSVSDTGIGLTEDQINRLFTSFSQADGSTTRKFGGTGLGLSICKRLIELMGGEINVTSEPDIGSTFAFTVSLGVRAEHSLDSLKEIIDPQSLRVLVIDDNLTARTILGDTLQSLGFSEIDLLPDGKSAIQKISEDIQTGATYDLILLDWHMPGMDGLETFRQIQALCDPDTLPATFLVTAHAREMVMRQVEKTAISGFLTKPLNTSILMDAIASHFGGNNQSRVLRHSTEISESDIREKLSGLRVLLAEDNEINQQVAREIMEDVGIQVSIADNGRVAVEKVQADPDSYDIILMDLQMPEMDGYEATANILAMPDRQNLPVIAMTAHALVEEREKCAAAGMVDHIAKPIDTYLFFQTLIRHAPSDLQSRPPMAKSDNAPVSTPTQQTITESIPDVMPATGDAAARLEEMRAKAGLKPESFAKLAHDFVASYQDFPEKLATAIGDNDRKTASRMAHTLSGLAGTFGCNQLQKEAKAYQIACDTGTGDSYPDTASLFDAFRHDFGNLRIALGDHQYSPKPAEEHDSADTIDRAALAEIIRRLDEGLAKNKMATRKLLPELQTALSGNSSIEFDHLSQLVSSLKFAEARDVLSGIAQSHDIGPEA
ncbi:response regulator [Alphaproteobacteria bacterium HT1-32]|nr:response regulator [Alphaproteobacteria bacterium HT1-32]